MEAAKEQEILKLHQAKFTVAEIAEEAEVSEGTVRSVLKAHGLTKPEPRVTSVDEGVATDYGSGVPVPEILKKYNLTYTKLYAVLNKTNTPLRRNASAPARESMMNTAVQMYQDGAPLWRIQEETGVPQPSLHNALHTRQIPLRRPRS